MPSHNYCFCSDTSTDSLEMYRRDHQYRYSCRSLQTSESSDRGTLIRSPEEIPCRPLIGVLVRFMSFITQHQSIILGGRLSKATTWYGANQKYLETLLSSLDPNDTSQFLPHLCTRLPSQRKSAALGHICNFLPRFAGRHKGAIDAFAD